MAETMDATIRTGAGQTQCTEGDAQYQLQVYLDIFVSSSEILFFFLFI